MRTVNRDSIVEWKTHMARMTNSLSSIQFEGKTASQTQAANEALKSLRDSVGFESKVIPLLRRGLSEYYEQVDATTHAEHPSEAKVSLMATYSFEASLFASIRSCVLTIQYRHSNLTWLRILLLCPAFHPTNVSRSRLNGRRGRHLKSRTRNGSEIDKHWRKTSLWM